MHKLSLLSAMLVLSACVSTKTEKPYVCTTSDGTENRLVRSYSAGSSRASATNKKDNAVKSIAYQSLFDKAYEIYPRIPHGTLEAIAYTQTGWENVNPSRDHSNKALDDIHMPRAYGIMGLYHGDMFSDQVSEGAKLLEISTAKVMSNPQSNILAAAALIDKQIRHVAKPQIPITTAELAEVLKRYAGFATAEPTGAVKASTAKADKAVAAAGKAGDGSASDANAVAASAGDQAVDAYIKDYFTYEILSVMANGVDDNGIQLPPRHVDIKSLFAPKRLSQFRASFASFANDAVITGQDASIFDVNQEKFLSTANDSLAPQPMTYAATRRRAAGKDYPAAIWKPSTEYSNRNQPVREVIIHTCEGSYSGCVSWLRRSKKSASGKRIYSSAHYVVSKSGQVAQLVNESKKAWHAKSHNPYAIGIEHEGFAKKPNQYTNSQYEASARLVRYLCNKYSTIDCLTARKTPQTRAGFGPVMGANVSIKGHQHASGNNHVDPGVYWDWRKYFTLLNPTWTGGPAVGGGYKVLDNFQYGMGHFATQPTFSATTKGVGKDSLVTRSCDVFHDDQCAMLVRLTDDPSTNSDWTVRLLSGKGAPSANASLYNNGRGHIGFWINTKGHELSVSVSIDDSDGTERAAFKTIPANCGWTYVEWNLSDSDDWHQWVRGNGRIDASEVRLDAIFVETKQSKQPVSFYIDRVLHKYK